MKELGGLRELTIVIVEQALWTVVVGIVVAVAVVVVEVWKGRSQVGTAEGRECGT